MSSDDPSSACGSLPLLSRWSVIIFVLALLVRALHLLGDLRSPFFEFRGIDALDYHKMAQGMLDGTWPHGQPFFWAPLYPVVLGVLYAIVGQASFALKLVQGVMGAASCVLVYRIGRRVFHRPSVAIAAGVVSALNGTMIYFDGQLLSASLDVFLLLLGLERLLAAPGGVGTKRWWGAGIVIALSAINRGGILLLLPFVLIWVWAVLRRRWPVGDREALPPASGKTVVRAFTAILVPPIVAIGLTVAHNINADWKDSRGDMGILPVAGNMGINFYLGNHWELREVNKTSHPQHFSHYDRIDIMTSEAGNEGVFAKSQFLFRNTLRDIAGDPMAFIKLLGVKFGELIHGREIPRNGNLYADRTHSPVIALLMWKQGIAFPAGVIIPLGLVGMGIALSNWRSHFLLLAAVSAHAVFILMFFVTARYRLPAMPHLTLFGSYAVSIAIVALRRRAWAKVVAIGGCTIGLGIAANWRVEADDPEHIYFEYCLLAQTYDEAGQLDRAIEYFRKGLSLNPDYAWGHLSLARALMRNGRWEEAETHFRRCLALEPDSPNVPGARLGLGRALARLGKLREAVRAWEEAVEYDPEFEPAHSELCQALPRIGRQREARTHCAAAERIRSAKDAIQ